KPADLRYPQKRLRCRRDFAPKHSPARREAEGYGASQDEPCRHARGRIMGSLPGNEQAQWKCGECEAQDLDIALTEAVPEGLAFRADLQRNALLSSLYYPDLWTCELCIRGNSGPIALGSHRQTI